MTKPLAIERVAQRERVRLAAEARDKVRLLSAIDAVRADADTAEALRDSTRATEEVEDERLPPRLEPLQQSHVIALPIEQLGGCPHLGLELGRRREIEAVAAPTMRRRPVDERHALPDAPAGPTAAEAREEVAQEARLGGTTLRRGHCRPHVV